jgi:hypothetical protein
MSHYLNDAHSSSLNRSHLIKRYLPHSFLTILLLAGDVEPNAGPPSFNICTSNIHSFFHPLHKTAILDLCDSVQPDVLALSETWIQSTFTPSELCDATPPSHSLLSQPRVGPSIAGDLAFLNLSLSRSNYPQQSWPFSIFTAHHLPRNTLVFLGLSSQNSTPPSHLLCLYPTTFSSQVNSTFMWMTSTTHTHYNFYHSFLHITLKNSGAFPLTLDTTPWISW